MLDKININIKKTLLAFIICLVAIPLARFISPQTIIDGNLIYIALAANQRDVFCYFYLWSLCDCAINSRVCHHQ